MRSVLPISQIKPSLIFTKGFNILPTKAYRYNRQLSWMSCDHRGVQEEPSCQLGGNSLGRGVQTGRSLLANELAKRGKCRAVAYGSPGLIPL